MAMYSGAFETSETPGLAEYLKAIQARKLLVILCTLLGIGAAYLFTESRTPTYDAGVRVLVAPSPVRSSNGTNLPKPNLETEREILASESIAQVVSRTVDGAAAPRTLLEDLNVRFRTSSEVLSLTYTFTDPEVTAAVANAFAENYVADRIAATTDFYASERETLEGSIASLETRIDTVDRDIRRIDAGIGDIETGDQVTLEAVRQERQVLANQRSQLTAERLRVDDDIRVLGAQERSRSVAAEVLELADPPQDPNGFGDRLLWALGALFGLLAGIVAAFVADRLDTTAREESDVELAIGQSVLGSVPPFGFGSAKGSAPLVMLSTNTNSKTQRAQESFRRLRTSVQFLASSDQLHSFLLTSSVPAEGKSTVSANLAVALAQAGNTVVLVSADMRRPTLETMFGIRNNEGLADHLRSNTADYPPVISVGIDNLALIPSGPSPANPGELLGSPNFKELIVQLEATYDFVIVDSPPVLSAADAPAAATSVGGVVIVVDSKRTDTSTLLQVRSDLERSGARIVGALLNKDRSRSTKFWSRRDRYAYERATADLKR